MLDIFLSFRLVCLSPFRFPSIAIKSTQGCGKDEPDSNIDSKVRINPKPGLNSEAMTLLRFLGLFSHWPWQELTSAHKSYPGIGIKV